MDIWKYLLRLWALVTLVSLAIDGVCVWIDAHGGAVPLLDGWGINYVTLFLWSAPAPFVSAILLPILGAGLGIVRWILRTCLPRRAVLTEQTHGHRHAAARRDAA